MRWGWHHLLRLTAQPLSMAELLSAPLAHQDGVHAGQSVPHVHVHILPRRPGDFEPVDKVYDALETVDISADHAKQAGEQSASGGNRVKMDSERKPRSAEEMHKEAAWLAALFPDNQP